MSKKAFFFRKLIDFAYTHKHKTKKKKHRKMPASFLTMNSQLKGD